jgi:serine/threonine-protein kinase
MSTRASLWSRAREHFRRLCDLDQAARHSALAQLRAADAALADYVAELLDADASGDCALSGAVAALRADFERQPPAGESRAGPWNLEARIGIGGMGEVWRARRPVEDFEQVAALKLLHRGLDSEALLGRFLQERRILARLEHPNIARMLDGGVTASGQPYLVMELVEGEPLVAFAARRALDIPAILRLFLRICGAVDFAHRSLVVHRDLKPSNILVDAQGEPKLLDFGIAKLLGDDAREQTVTATSFRALTPAYAAPEQFAGEPVTTATDVYALGLILYELLTGELPRERGKTSQSGPTEDVTTRPSAALRRLAAERSDDPRIRRLQRQVGGDLDAIVLTALRADPGQRYPTASALAEDLKRLLDGHPVRARGDSLGYRMRRFARRHKAGVAASAVALLAMLAATTISLTQAHRASQALARMEREFSRAEAEQQKAEAAKSFLLGLFEVANPANPEGDASRTVLDLLRSADGQLVRRLQGQPLVQAEMRLALASALRSFGDSDEAYRLTVEAMEALTRDAAAPALAQAVGHHLRGSLLADQRRLAEAETEAREALRLFATLPPTPDHAKRMRAARTTLALVFNQTGRESEALDLRRRDLEERSAEPDPDLADLATAWYNLGVSYLRLERFREAVEAFENTEALLATGSSEASVRHVFAWTGLASALNQTGRFAEARERLGRAQDMVDRYFSGHSRLVASVAMAASSVALREGRFDDAGQQAWIAWRLAIVTGATDASNAAQILINYLLVRGEWQEAARVAEVAAEISIGARGAEHQVSRHLAAAAAFARWNLGGAASDLAELEGLVRALSGANERLPRAQTAAWLGFALKDRSPDEARFWEREAAEALAQIYDEGHPWRSSLAGSAWIARR